MDREGKSTEKGACSNRYEAALARFQEGGEIERIFEQSFLPAIESAQSRGEEVAILLLTNCVGDTLSLSDEQMAYVDAAEEYLVVKGYEIEEVTDYVPSDGTLAGNRTYVRLFVTLK